MKIRIEAKTPGAELVLKTISRENMKSIGKMSFVSKDPLILEIRSMMMNFVSEKLRNNPVMKENIQNTFKGIIENAGGNMENFEVSTC